MRITRVALLSFASVCSLVTTSSCWAGDPTLFASFPESCATQAQKQYNELEEMRATTKLKGRGIELFDSNSPAANSAEYAFRFVDRLTVSGELLTLGISNFTKPRISKRAQREAQKILTAFTSELPVFFHNLDVTPASPSPQKQDQYHCITETCPKGVACTTIDVEQQKVDLLAKLKTFRKYNNQTFRWANSVKVFGAKVARLRKEYDRDEAELKQLIEEIPNSLVVIDVTVPIK